MAGCLAFGSFGSAVAAEPEDGSVCYEEVTATDETGTVDMEGADTGSDDPATKETGDENVITEDMPSDDTGTEGTLPDSTPEDGSAENGGDDTGEDGSGDNTGNDDAGADESSDPDPGADIVPDDGAGTNDQPPSDDDAAAAVIDEKGVIDAAEAKEGTPETSNQDETSSDSLTSDPVQDYSEAVPEQVPEGEEPAEVEAFADQGNDEADPADDMTESISVTLPATENSSTGDNGGPGPSSSGNGSRASSDFRFIQVEKQPAVTTDAFCGLIREEADETSRAVGILAKGGVVYLLAKTADWYFVESGDVRGFVRQDDLDVKNDEDSGEAALVYETLPLGKSLCSPDENKNFAYTHTTVREVMAKKREAFLIGQHKIYEYADEHARSVGTGVSGCLVYLLGTAGKGWYYIESDDVRGFIRYEDLITGEVADVIASNIPEDSLSTAIATIEPEKNRSLYFTLMSVKESTLQESPGLIRFYSPDGMAYSQDQLELIWAIVAQEDNGSYEGALAVITSAVNRSESATWGYLGSDAYSQLTAPGQYCYSLDDYWRYWLGGNVPDYVKTAVDDCLVRGIRNHPYTSFRSTQGKTTGNNAVQIGGNWYFGS